MLQKQNASVLETSTLSETEIAKLFSKAKSFEVEGWPTRQRFSSRGSTPTVSLLFFEPSTRTRMSFQIASYRLSLNVQTMELGPGSSLAKGETIEDTILNFAAMRPDLMVVRHGGASSVDSLLGQLGLPVLSAGSGVFAHPTQGLLDAYTLWREWGERLEGKKLLIVGDIQHSRVAASARELFPRLGVELKFAGPKEWLPQNSSHGQIVEIDSGLDWCDAVMGLRVQFERHDSLKSLTAAERAAQITALGEKYHREFGLNETRLKLLKPSARILHPGPINHGVEFSQAVGNDPRSRVLVQVENGVFIRAALIDRALGISLAHRDGFASSNSLLYKGDLE